MELSLETKDKLLMTQAIDWFKKPEFNNFEKSELIEELIKTKRLQCPKCAKKILKEGKSTSKTGGKYHWCPKCAKVVENLAKDLSISARTIYEIRRLTETAPETLEYVKEAISQNKITQQKASRALSNLNVKNRGRKDIEIEILGDIIDDDMSTEEIDILVSETNNPKIIQNHGLNALLKASQQLKLALVKLPKNCKKNVEVEDTIQLCKDMIKKIEKK